MDHLITIAADSIESLRAVDVYRVLEWNEGERIALAAWITKQRPDLANEVTACMEELAQ